MTPYEQELTDHIKTIKKYNHVLELLLRIARCYEPVFKECVTEEDIEKILGG